MRHFVFEDDVTGESFIVGADTLMEAVKTAKEYFEEPFYLFEFSEFEAESSGLDEY